MKRKKKKTKRVANNYALLPETIELVKELTEGVMNGGQVIDLAIRYYARSKLKTTLSRITKMDEVYK